MKHILAVNDLRSQVTGNSEVKITGLLSMKEVCAYLSVTLPTLHRWRKVNILTPSKIGGKVFYKAHDIEALLNVAREGGVENV